jgi:hypothetical protein
MPRHAKTDRTRQNNTNEDKTGKANLTGLAKKRPGLLTFSF